MTEEENTKTIRLKMGTVTTVILIIVAFGVGYFVRDIIPGTTGKFVETSTPQGSSGTQEQNDVDKLVAELKEEVKCTCGCGWTLEDCVINDPGCTTRPGIISRIEELAKQGKTKQEILNSLQAPSEPSRPQAPTAPVEVSADDDASKGSDNAPVVMIEFSDFECPFCARFWSDTLPQIEEEYIDTGKVKFVYRDFPLGFHQNAQKAAEAAECAEDQGKYWEYHDKIFENQRAIDVASLKQYAKDLDLDSQKFDDCLDSGKYASEVQKDFQDGQAAGVTGTPAFFINGQKVTGAQPFSNFKQVIDSELSK